MTKDHKGTVSIGGRIFTNLRFADDIGGLAGTKTELKSFVNNLYKASRAYVIDFSPEKTKLLANNIAEGPLTDSYENDQALDTVNQCKYLGAIVSDEGSRPEDIARIAQATSALAKLKTICWSEKN